MKKTFTADPAQFRAAVAWVARWVPARPSVPVWSGLLLEARDGQLTLCGYDEDVSARAGIPIEGEASGTVLVSGRLLAALVATFPAGKPVEAEADDTLLTLRTGRVTVTLPLMGASDFPTLPVAPSSVAVMDGTVLADAVGRVVPAAAKDPAQGIWCATRLEFADDRLEVVASDIRRVARVYVPATGCTAAVALVPAAVVGEAVKMMAASSEVEIGISGNLVSFTVAGRTLTVRQAAEKYNIGQIHKILKLDPPEVATVPVLELMPAVKRAGLMKAEGHPTILQWSAGEVAVSAKGADAGSEAAETIDVEYDGPDTLTAVNPAYLSDAVEAVTATAARIAFDPGKPAQAIVITDPDDPDFRHVMVPIKLSAIAPKAKPS